MKKAVILLVIGGLSVLFFGCISTMEDQQPTNSNSEGFAIYLPADEIYLWEIETLTQIELAEDPILSFDEIIEYNVNTHEIWIVPKALKRFGDQNLAGKPFVVCVDKEPIYAGEFMAMYMSRSSEGVVILLPLFSEEEQFIKLQLGYPGPDFFVGEDPRMHPKIIESLIKIGVSK